MSRPQAIRGVLLPEILFAVPLVAVAFTVTYQVTVRAVQLERATLAEFAQDARRADLVRRIGDDARCAYTARLERSDAGVLLELRCPPAARTDEHDPALVRDDASAPERMIRYRIIPGHILRSEAAAEGVPAEYRWPLEAGGMDLSIEQIAGETRLLWISFTKVQTRMEGPGISRTLTTAVRIGQGGAS